MNASALASICTTPDVADACLNEADPIAACEARLATDPSDARVRLSLCTAHLDNGDHTRAQLVVEEGMGTCGRRACNEYQVVLSNIEELRLKVSSEDPNATQINEEVLRGYCLGPIANQRSIDACQQLLVSHKRDVELLEALGTKFAKQGRAADAVRVLTRAKSAGSNDASIEPALAAAKQARAALARECVGSGSLTQCDLALLKGGSDEFDIQQRRGVLLANEGRKRAAFVAFRIAQQIRPKHQGVARQIVKLAPSEAQKSPDNPAVFEAQARAFLALGTDAKAIPSLQRVVQLDPGNTEMSRLLEATVTEHDQLQNDCLEERRVEACNSLIASVDDSNVQQEIRDFVTVLQSEATEVAEPADAADASLVADTAAVADPDTREGGIVDTGGDVVAELGEGANVAEDDVASSAGAAAPVEAPKPIVERPARPRPELAIRFTNTAYPDGTTH